MAKTPQSWYHMAPHLPAVALSQLVMLLIVAVAVAVVIPLAIRRHRAASAPRA